MSGVHVASGSMDDEGRSRTLGERKSCVCECTRVEKGVPSGTCIAEVLPRLEGVTDADTEHCADPGMTEACTCGTVRLGDARADSGTGVRTSTGTSLADDTNVVVALEGVNGAHVTANVDRQTTSVGKFRAEFRKSAAARAQPVFTPAQQKPTRKEMIKTYKYECALREEQKDQQRLRSLSQQLQAHTQHLQCLKRSLTLLTEDKDVEALTAVDRELLEIANLVGHEDKENIGDTQSSTLSKLRGDTQSNKLMMSKAADIRNVRRKKHASSLRTQINLLKDKIRCKWHTVAALSVRARSESLKNTDAIEEAAEETSAKWTHKRNPKCTSEERSIDASEAVLPLKQVSPRTVYARLPKEALQQMSDEDSEEGRAKICSLIPQTQLKEDNKVRYQSMQAELSIGAKGCSTRLLKVIVDSGAAWSCIGLRALRRHYPELEGQLNERYSYVHRPLPRVEGARQRTYCKLNVNFDASTGSSTVDIDLASWSAHECPLMHPNFCSNQNQCTCTEF